jgi:hypothetical protein
MALPTKSDLETMDYSFNGEPFVDVPGNSSIDLMTMDWSYLGEPFVRNGAGGVTASPRRCLLGAGV